jgi:hypothetical protein
MICEERLKYPLLIADTDMAYLEKQLTGLLGGLYWDRRSIFWNKEKLSQITDFALARVELCPAEEIEETIE